MPQDLKDARFTQLYENKGDKSKWNNRHGISLLYIFGKIVSRIILPKLQVIGQRIYPGSQCGYKPGRSTTDMIFSVFVFVLFFFQFVLSGLVRISSY